VSLAACTPSAAGFCGSDTECKADERCYQGLCIRRELLDDGGADGGSDAGSDGGSDAGTDGGSDAGTDGGSDGGSDAGTDGGSDGGSDAGSDAGTDGGSDAGTDGGSDAGTLAVRIDEPLPGAWLGGAFHVAATAISPAPPDDVTFTLRSGGGAVLGTLRATLPGGGTFAGDLAVTDGTASGAATLEAEVHAGAQSAQATPVAVAIDQVAPGISLALLSTPDVTVAATGWFRATGSDLVVLASLDAGAGSPIDAGSVTLSWAGGSVAYDVSKPLYTFAVPRGAGAGVQGAKAFTLGAADVAGNPASAPVNIDFDDVPPAIGAALVAPSNWVARLLPDGGPAPAVVIVAASDDGTGVGSLRVYNGDGGTALSASAAAPSAPGQYTLATDVSSAPAGAAGAFAIRAAAIDVIGNQSSRDFALSVDDAKPVITQVGGDVDPGWHSGLSGSTTAQVSPVATIVDQGSGVAGSPTLSLPDGGAVSTGSLISGGTALSGRWQFTAFNVPPDPTMNGPVTFTVRAVDAVGNAGTSADKVKLNVDNVPPQVGAPDYARDSGSATVLRGPNVKLGGDAATIDVAALVVDDNLQGTPSATFSGTGSPVAGVINVGDGKWHFAIPRGLGLGGGNKRVTIGAADKAQNASTAFVDLPFEDAPVAFTVSTDSTWYARAAGTLSVVATVTGALPPSNLAGKVLAGGSCSNVAPTSSSGDGLTHTFSFDKQCAPAGQEGAVGLSVTLTSGAGVVSTVNGSRNIDDKPPVVGNFTAPSYPGASGTELGFSHDGSHFNVNDGAVAVGSVNAYDCGGGLGSTPQVSIDGLAAVTPATSDVPVTCPDGHSTTQRTYAVTANFKNASAWAYGLDAAPNISVTVSDTFGHGASKGSSVNVTRRLWRTGNLGVNRLAAGPYLFAAAAGALYSLSPANGSAAWGHSASITAGPVVLPNGGNPVVYWSEPGAAPAASIVGASASAGGYTQVSICGVSNGNTSNLVDLLLAADGSTIAGRNSYSDTQPQCSCLTSFPCNDADYCETHQSQCLTCINVTQSGKADVALGPSGSCVASPVAGVDATIAVGRGWAYWIGGPNWQARQVGGAGSASVAGPSGNLLVVDNGAGNDRVISGSDAWRDFTGSWGASSSAGIVAPLVALSSPPRLLGYTASGWGYRDFGGGAHGPPVASAVGPLPPLIDGARPTAVAYLVGIDSAQSLHALWLDASNGFSGGGPMSFPGGFPAAIDDLVLAAGGTLYVASGGAVSAFATDSPGLGTNGSAALGWPARHRDACRSRNLAVACPY